MELIREFLQDCNVNAVSKATGITAYRLRCIGAGKPFKGDEEFLLVKFVDPANEIKQKNWANIKPEEVKDFLNSLSSVTEFSRVSKIPLPTLYAISQGVSEVSTKTYKRIRDFLDTQAEVSK